jgi:hypothetical protein
MLLRSAPFIVTTLSILFAASKLPAQATFTEQSASVLPGLNLNSRSASLADIDDDGDLDLFFQTTSAPRLYRNNVVGTGSLTFTNISSSHLPATGIGDGWSAAWGDYNGDGRIDVFMGQTNGGGSGDVLTNRGASGFTNDSVATGLNDPGWHQNVAWSDIDNDRDLDLLIGMEGPTEKHEIYLQGANGKFTPVGAAAGFQQNLGTKAYGMAIGDTDGDGDLDVYISTCRIDNNVRNNFYQNMLADTGALSFVDIADSNGTQTYHVGRVTTYANSYGAEFVDLDDDQDLDLFLTGADHLPTKIFRNDGGNMFTDVDEITGHALLSDAGSDLNGSRVVDYDNDGDLDLFFHDHLKTVGDNARKLYRNDGGWQFTDVTALVGIAETNLGSYDSTWGDLDLDGDQDLVATTDARTTPIVATERFYISNASESGNHWLYLRLAGPTDNTTGIGASVYATINAGTPDERTLRREANTNAGTFNQSDLPVHFGLGPADHIDLLSIHWPDGTIQDIRDLDANQYLTIHTPGDFNGDGQVDAGDLAQWQGDFAESGLSDADYDGDADGHDFLFWQRQLGNGVRPPSQVAAATASVPEPTAAILFLLAAAAFLSQRRVL